VLVYGKPPVKPWWMPFADIFSGGKEMDEDDWQPAEAEAEHYLAVHCPAAR
jgi:hypothetical protein